MLTLDPDLINSCRVCRSPNQEGDYQCLFETVSEHAAGHIELTESGTLYEKLLDIPLNEKIYYPKFLCNSCHLQMKLFMKLKDKAIKSLEYFQSNYEEVYLHTAENAEEETSNYNYQSNVQAIPSPCPSLLDGYQLKEYKVYQENVPNEYAESVGDEFGKPIAEATAYANYNSPKIEENKWDILAADNSFNGTHMEQEHCNSMSANIESNIDEGIKVQTDNLENRFLNEIEPNENINQALHSEEHFPDMKVDQILDKNDYITEIYELIDDEYDIEETYLENQEIIENVDYNTASEVNTETSSTYNDIEYLQEEESDYLEDEGSVIEIRSPAKRRKLQKGCSSTNRTYQCFTCGLEFNNFQLYKLHSIEAHTATFKCKICSKEFKTMTSLQKHIKLQHKEEPAFQCDICQKTFNQKVHFQYHMNYHNNIRKFKCHICGKAFIGKADLKTHLRTHTGERPYICKVCGKDYIMMEHLKAHFITHTEQIFTCDVCHKQFSTHKTLRLHVRTIHEDEPRFKCTICLKPFRRKHHLEYHMKSHERNSKNLKTNDGIIEEQPDNLDDIVEESIDDPDFGFLA